MSSALDSTSPPKARPRHLGLPRRQSYDLLSTSTSKASLSQALSLGNLPSPTFSHIPAGQRSVPAVEMNRMLGHDRAFRSISGPLGDGQRTPGGSLVVGAEIFGFGGPKAKDRWTSTSIQGEGSDAGGSDAGHTPRSSAAIQLEAAPAGWPSEIEQAVASKDHKSHQTLEGSGVSHTPGMSGFVCSDERDAVSLGLPLLTFVLSFLLVGLHLDWLASTHTQDCRLSPRFALVVLRQLDRHACPCTLTTECNTSQVRSAI